jgi:UDP-glucose 4-epimerase
LKFETRKVVVTGGAGFIGSHISEELLKRGCEVTVIDNLSTGKIKNIEHLLAYENLKFVQGSVASLFLLRGQFVGIDCVFHQAAIPSIPGSIENPAGAHESNLNGTFNVLLAARDNRVKKVVFASSAAIYGDSSNNVKSTLCGNQATLSPYSPLIVQSENLLPNPLSPYAVNKLAAEYYCNVFNTVYGLPTVCLRYFNVYGPRQDPHSEYDSVIKMFAERINQGKSLNIYGDGEQTCDFVYVKDVVAANILAAENPITGVFNIGSGEKTSLNQLVKILAKVSGHSDIEVTYGAERPGEIKHSLADITKARQFGYKPEWSLEKGLIELVKSFQLPVLNI